MLNAEQRKVYDRYYQWCITDNENVKNKQSTKPLQEFITGGAGTGKTFLLNCIRDMINLVLSEQHGDVEYVLVMAPTGVAAHLINGKTLHSALKLTVDQKYKNDQQDNLHGNLLESLRAIWRFIKWIVIDEISMVGARRFHQIAQRLQQLSGIANGMGNFKGLNVILIGDPFQLRPIRDVPIFKEIAGMPFLWNEFDFVELHQNMRQRGDTRLQTLLNNVRVGMLSFDDKQLLMSRVALDDSYYVGIFAPENTTHIYPTRKLVDEHNQKVLQKVSKDNNVKIYSIEAIDSLPNGTLPEGKTLEDVTPKRTEDTCGIQKVIHICLGARIMLIKNINVDKGLTNGAFGRITHIEWPLFHKDQVTGEHPKHITIKFDHLDKEVNLGSKVFKFDGLKVGIIERVQFPIITAWACTSHKLQGCTVPSAVCYLGSQIFAHGQPYVSLSRVRSLETLLIRELEFERIESYVNQEALIEMQRLRDRKKEKK